MFLLHADYCTITCIKQHYEGIRAIGAVSSSEYSWYLMDINYQMQVLAASHP